MTKRLAEMHGHIVKLNKFLNNKIFSPEDIEDEKKSWEGYCRIMEKIEKLLDELKSTSPEDLLKDNSFILSNMCAYLGIIYDDLGNLRENLIKIIQTSNK